MDLYGQCKAIIEKHFSDPRFEASVSSELGFFCKWTGNHPDRFSSQTSVYWAKSYEAGTLEIDLLRTVDFFFYNLRRRKAEKQINERYLGILKANKDSWHKQCTEITSKYFDVSILFESEAATINFHSLNPDIDIAFHGKTLNAVKDVESYIIDRCQEFKYKPKYFADREIIDAINLYSAKHFDVNADWHLAKNGMVARNESNTGCLDIDIFLFQEASKKGNLFKIFSNIFASQLTQCLNTKALQEVVKRDDTDNYHKWLQEVDTIS